MSFDQYKDRIIAGESGGDANALYGHRTGYGTPTEMTFGEVFYDLAASDGAYARDVKNELGYTATPVGLYQVVGSTGRSMMEKHGIDPNLPFTEENQEMLARLIYEEQGPGAWEALKKDGSVSARDHINQFDNMLAFEAEPMSARHKTARVLGNAGDRLMALGSGRGLPQMLRGDLQYQNNEKRHGRNQTAQYLSKMGMNDLASAVATGQMSGGAAMNLMYQYAGAGGAGGANEETWSTTPRVLTMPDGTTQTVLVSNQGNTRPLDGDMTGNLKKVKQADGSYVWVDPKTSEQVGETGAGHDKARMATAEQKLYDAERSYMTVMTPILSNMARHPGLYDAVGDLSGRINKEDAGYALMSDDAKAFIGMHDQLKGQQFLTAFESLKGAGPITDVEGQKATDALSRLDRQLSPTEYLVALQEFNTYLQSTIEAYRKEAIGGKVEYAPLGDLTKMGQAIDEAVGGTGALSPTAGDPLGLFTE